MSNDLEELYQEVILDHSRKPRNFQKLEAANRVAEGFNPLCGDHFTVYAVLDGDVIRDIAFQGSGCAISKASASLMTAAIKGRTKAEAEKLFGQFHDLVTVGLPNVEEIGKLGAFAGVKRFPARVKCAILAWHALKAILDGKANPVSTE